MIYSGNQILAPHPRPAPIKNSDLDEYFSLGAPLTPQVQTFNDPIVISGMPSGAPPVGMMPSYKCPAPFVPYAAYIDQAGNYEYPGCMMPQGVTPVIKPATVTSPSTTQTGSTSGTSSSTSTTSTSTTSSTPGAAPDNTMLLIAAIVAAVLLSQ